LIFFASFAKISAKFLCAGVETMESLYSKKALLQKKIGDGVRCLLCERSCSIFEGKMGWCKTRKNIGGTLYTATYGNIASISANPVEKKPFFHFYPGSKALTAGTFGCNFPCRWCQNWTLSKVPPQKGEYWTPEVFVEATRRLGCQGTSISFNEPTLMLEWALDVFRLAKEGEKNKSAQARKKDALYNTFVTNGYMTLEALQLLLEAGLDAVNVDIKGTAYEVKKYCGADVEIVWRNSRFLKERGVHIEITTLIIPTVNDSEASP
jgi:pyruvate formate lyase activating enzyme